MRRQPRSDDQVDAHDALGGDPRDVDGIVAVQHRDRARLAQRVDDALHERLRDVGDVDGRQVGEAQIEDARRQREVRSVVHDVAELLQRQEVAAGHGARETGAAGDVGDREAAPAVGGERLDDGEAALQPLDELALARVVLVRSRGRGVATRRGRPAAARRGRRARAERGGAGWRGGGARRAELDIGSPEALFLVHD